MLGARFGHFLDKPLATVVKKIDISPNALTIIGFLVTVAAALVIPYSLRIGGILIICGSLFDMLDGIVARVNNRVTRFGAFLDSVLDRYSDGLLFLSIAWYLLEKKGDHTGAVLSLGTLVGAFLISYARARAEGLGEECQKGIMERSERLTLLIFAALTGWVVPVLWVMLILTHVTVVQRFVYVRKRMAR